MPDYFVGLALSSMVAILMGIKKTWRLTNRGGAANTLLLVLICIIAFIFFGFFYQEDSSNGALGLLGFLTIPLYIAVREVTKAKKSTNTSTVVPTGTEERIEAQEGFAAPLTDEEPNIEKPNNTEPSIMQKFCSGCGSQLFGAFCSECGRAANSTMVTDTHDSINGHGADIEATLSTQDNVFITPGKSIEKKGFWASAMERADELNRQKAEEKRQLKERIAQMDREGKAYCPKCYSADLTAHKKGFGAGKAAVGAVLWLPLAAAGGIGSGKVKVTCLKCGHQFRPGKRK
ncbi:MAG: hypothetical protein FH749_08005 [Firmicutes bacterium]|nr:hypothetical protein [Bacillota bacterium]